MNEELQKQISEILKQAISAVHQGGHWLAGQIPDVLQQLIVWTVCVGIAWLIFIVVSAFACIRVWKLALRWANESEGTSVGGAVVVTFTIFLIDVFGGAFGVIDGLKALVAPKLFLLEYAANIVR